MLKNILIVGFGGGVGSIARYLCQKYLYDWTPQPFPLGTFVVNIVGCFLIGVFYAGAERNSILTPQWRLLLTTGFCGGYTTFSTFAFENMSLIKQGNLLTFFLYTVGSVVLGIAAVFIAISIFK